MTTLRSVRARTLLATSVALALALTACGKGEPTAADPPPTEPPTTAEPAPTATPAAAAPAPTGAPATADRAPDAPAPDDRAATTTDDVDPGDADGRVERLIGALAAYSRGALDEALGALAADAVVNRVGATEEGELRGRDAVAAYAREARAALSEARVTPTRVFIAGDWLVAEVIFSGVHAGAPEVGLPDGARYGFAGALAARFDDAGRIAQVDVFADDLTRMAQLGAARASGDSPPVRVPGEELDRARIVVVRGEADPGRLAVVARWYEGLGPDGLEATLDALATEGLALASPSTSERIEGRAAVATALRDGAFTAFASWETRAGRTLAVGDHVIVWATDHATYRAAGSDGPAVPITTHGLGILRVDGDRVAEHLLYTNGAELMAQLGAAAAPEPGDRLGGLDDEALDAELEQAKRELQEAIDELDATMKEAMEELGGDPGDLADEMKAIAEDARRAAEEAERELEEANRELERATRELEAFDEP